jgi:hypothetical protein
MGYGNDTYNATRYTCHCALDRLLRPRSATKPPMLTYQNQSWPAAASQRSYRHVLYFDKEPLGFDDDDTVVEQPARDEPFAPVDAVQRRLDL